MITRRSALLALGAASACAALPTLAQQPAKVWRVGYLSALAQVNVAPQRRFVEGMRELGYVEGKNLLIDWRFGTGDPASFAALAAELLAFRPDAILAGGTLAVAAAQKA